METETETEDCRRGDIVWARVVYPHQWWPGIVLRIDFLGVLVSFFAFQKPRYFLESEVCSFEQNYKSHVKKCTNNTLLFHALKFFGRQIISSLTFPGQVETQHPSPSNLFRPQMVLGFVRSIAVSPWIEEVDFASAVNGFAQTFAFLRYLVKSNVNSRVHSVDGELDTSEVGDDCQVFSDQGEKNLPACLVNRKNMSNHFPTKSLSCSDEDQLDVSSFQSTSDIISETCSSLETGEARISIPSDITSQLGVHVHREKEKTALPLISYMESAVNCLDLKRELDQSAVSECPLKLSKTSSFSINRSDARLWRSRSEHDAALFDFFVTGKAFDLLKFLNTMPFSSNGAYGYLQRNTSGCEADLFDSSFSGYQVKLETQDLSSTVAQSLTYLCSSSDIVKETSRPSDNLQICMDQNLDENVKTLDNSESHISSANTQQPCESEVILKDDGTCLSYTHDATETMAELSAVQSTTNHATGTRSKDNVSGEEIAGTRKYLLHSHFTADELKVLPSHGDNSASSQTAKLPGFNLKSCLKKSRSLENEDKRHPKKVRFLLVS